MAKFEIKSIYTFTDELTGEQVTQDSEPTTFKIKLTGDAKTYEKVMSAENEQFFRDWLDNDGADLVGRYQDKIDKLNRQIAELVDGAAKTKRASSGKPRSNTYGALVGLLADNGVDKTKLIELVQAIDPEVDSSKRLPLDHIKQVVRDKQLEQQASDLGYPVNS